MMTTAFGTVVVLTGWIAVASAQQPPSPSNEPAHKIYVMTGCLELGSGSISVFRLTGAEHVGQAPPSGGSAPRANTVYALQPAATFGEQGISRDQLKGHVGKRVEVTVRPVEVTPAPSSPPRATDSVEKPEQPPPQRYTVVKINQLADSCR